MTLPLGVVTEQAVLKRVNRRLRPHSQAVRTHRSADYCGLQGGRRGNYYLIDIDRNAMLDAYVDLESFAREIGALDKYEHIAD